MDAIEYLTEQHREIESLFDQVESAVRMGPRRRLRRKLFDLLAVHAAIEERLFYPAARDAGVEERLLGALVEHLSVERIVAEIVERGETSAGAAARMSHLRDRKAQHARDEEEELFPRVKELLTPDRLELLGRRMASAADQLMDPGAGARERVTARRALA